MTLFLLDTNTVSYIVHGRSASARATLLNLKNVDAACISAITEGEIRYGLARRPQATAFKALMEKFLDSIRSLPWGSEEAKAYGALRASMDFRRTQHSSAESRLDLVARPRRLRRAGPVSRPRTCSRAR